MNTAPTLPFTGDPALTCPWCGTEEPNRLLLDQNHWVRDLDEAEYDWCAAHQECIAQNLRRNHVVYYRRKLAERRPNPGKKHFDEDECRRLLAHAETLAAEIGVDVAAIRHEADA